MTLKREHVAGLGGLLRDAELLWPTKLKPNAAV